MADLKTAQPLHSESIAFVEFMKQFRSEPFFDLPIEEIRSNLKKLADSEKEADFDGERKEIMVPIPGVREGIPVWVYKPSSVASNPAILVYFHGGGLVLGSRSKVDAICKTFSSGAGCIIVNVEYRLAPEHQFPTGILDGIGVTQWVMENKTLLGGSERCKVGVAGDSAGGTIAATVGHEVPEVAFEILVYPQLTAHGEYNNLPSWQEYKDGPKLDLETIIWFDKQISGESSWTDPKFANLLREQFDHLPPTLFIVAECDILRDDSYEYCKKLEAARVFTEFHLAKGAIHAFFALPGHFPVLCKDAHGKVIDFIKRFGMC